MCEVSSSYAKRKSSYRAETVKRPNMTLTFGPKLNRGPHQVMVNTSVKYHHCKSKRKVVIVQKVLKVWSSHFTFTFDLLTPESIEVILGSWSTHVWSIITVGQKQKELLCRNLFSTERWTGSQPWWNQYTTPTHNFVGGGGGGGGGGIKILIAWVHTFYFFRQYTNMGKCQSLKYLA